MPGTEKNFYKYTFFANLVTCSQSVICACSGPRCRHGRSTALVEVMLRGVAKRYSVARQICCACRATLVTWSPCGAHVPHACQLEWTANASVGRMSPTALELRYGPSVTEAECTWNFWKRGGRHGGRKSEIDWTSSRYTGIQPILLTASAQKNVFTR